MGVALARAGLTLVYGGGKLGLMASSPTPCSRPAGVWSA
jgi:hypothetical protein